MASLLLVAHILTFIHLFAAGAYALPAAGATVAGLDHLDQAAATTVALAPAAANTPAAWPALFLAIVAIAAITLSFWLMRPGDLAGPPEKQPPRSDSDDTESPRT